MDHWNAMLYDLLQIRFDNVQQQESGTGRSPHQLLGKTSVNRRWTLLRRAFTQLHGCVYHERKPSKKALTASLKGRILQEQARSSLWHGARATSSKAAKEEPATPCCTAVCRGEQFLSPMPPRSRSNERTNVERRKTAARTTQQAA
jgi:hypothetical protein